MDDGDDDDEKLGNLKNEAAVEEVSTTEEAEEGEISFDEDDVLDTHEEDALPGKRINCAPLHGLAPRASVLPADFG